MPTHLLAYSESVDQTLDNIAAVANDPIFTVSGDDVTINGAWGIINALYCIGASAERARLVAPSLRGRFTPDFVPVDVNAEPASRPPVIDLRRSPIVIKDRERLNFQAENDGAAGAEQVVGLLWMSDGPVSAVDPAGAMPIRWTGTVTSVANVFTSHTITLANTLPAGTYELLGVRYQGATAIAYRVVAVGQAHRPGGVAFDSNSDQLPDLQKPGEMGVLCRFKDDQVPQLEVLANTAAAQSPEGILWVRRVGD